MTAAGESDEPAGAPPSPARRRLRPTRRGVALVFAGLLATAAFAAVMFAVRSEGDRQVNFVSRETRFGDTGGRGIYYPELGTALVKVWALPLLPEGLTYQVWAMDGAVARPLGIGQPFDFRELDVAYKVDLSRASSLVLTVEPLPGSPVLTQPPVIELVREP